MNIINYQNAKKFVSDSLIEECIERRHITLGWQHAGNIGESIRRLVESSVGQFRKQISGVPIALGTIRLLKPIYILEDHNCMHIDFEVQMIVLKVQPGERYESEGEKVITCHANQILNKGVVGTAFGNIGVVCSPAPHGIKVGDTFSACFMSVKFRNSICQLQTIPLSVKKFNN